MSEVFRKGMVRGGAYWISTVWSLHPSRLAVITLYRLSWSAVRSEEGKRGIDVRSLLWEEMGWMSWRPRWWILWSCWIGSEGFCNTNQHSKRCKVHGKFTWSAGRLTERRNECREVRVVAISKSSRPSATPEDNTKPWILPSFHRQSSLFSFQLRQNLSRTPKCLSRLSQSVWELCKNRMSN